MGGPNSGRWHDHTKATTVQDCLDLDLNSFARERAFTPGFTGAVHWRRGGVPTGSVGYTVRQAGSGLVLVLSYSHTSAWDATREAVELPIVLESLPQHLGGVRWWARCPLVLDGRPCSRRVGKLYLPPGGRYFGCRCCYGLTYTSCQESHQDDRLARVLARNMGVDFAAARRALAQLGKTRC
jgi:hypothetical protein